MTGPAAATPRCPPNPLSMGMLVVRVVLLTALAARACRRDEGRRFS
ncbi:hypothetical protein ABZ793_05525 [Micromonospora sp. NPDC047465]